MIKIDRNRIPAPEFLLKEGATEKAKATAFFAQDFKARSDRDFSFKVFRDKSVREALEKLFHHKCAFCETLLTTLNVETFRPKVRALDLRGKLSPDHYWWLASEWTNLYPICSECMSRKGSRFPINGLERANADTPLSDLAQFEQPLLLDPCYDNPDDHLVFSEDGKVASDTRRGQVTIEIFGLNRPSLVEARLADASHLRASFDQFLNTINSNVFTQERGLAKRGQNTFHSLDGDSTRPETFLSPDQPFLGMRLQLFQHWTQEKITNRIEVQRSQEERNRTFEDYSNFKQSSDTFSLNNADSLEDYFLSTHLIEEIEIKDFRAIEHLKLKMPSPNESTIVTSNIGSSEASQQAWLMLLGENGTGKSSILQAIAMTLVDKTYLDKLPVKPDEILRKNSSDKQGFVAIKITGLDEPVRLTFNEGDTTFNNNREQQQILLLAYGSTRLLPNKDDTSQHGTESARIDNLFDHFTPLNNAESWLLKVWKQSQENPEDDTYYHIRRALKNLLMLEEGDDFIPLQNPERIELKAFGTQVRLRQLSDGYQSVLALATDIMAVMLDKWAAMEVAEGIVLIDEMGAHLHPRWQMRIVKSLRTVFPRVQFLVTTHNPLCLRGLGEGEVIVLQRDEDHRVVTITDLPPIEGLRVDQLLTSEHFGMSSTMDPDIEQKFDEYYSLKAKRKRSKREDEQLKDLAGELERLQVMGRTRRERIMLEAVDEYLSEQPEALDLQQKQSLKKSTKRKILDAWNKKD